MTQLRYKNLHVVTPGLLGPFDQPLPGSLSRQIKQSAVKSLARALSNADDKPFAVKSFYATLQSCINPQCELNLCQLSLNYDGLDLAPQNSHSVYRADPVHFKAELDHAVLLDPAMLSPTREQAEALGDAFNQHFADDGVQLHIGAAERWYLQVDRKPKLECFSLEYALGRDIKHFMPRGEDALWWRRIVNEAQMLFFQHPVNQQREAQGQLAINGLWLWDLPAGLCELQHTEKEGDRVYALDKQVAAGAQAKPQVQAVYADHPVARALAKCAPGGIDLCIDLYRADDYFQPQAADLLEASKSHNALLVLTDLYPAVSYGDMQAWAEALHEFTESRFKVLMEQLYQGAIEQLYIYPCDGWVYQINSKQRWKFWKPEQALDSFIQQV